MYEMFQHVQGEKIFSILHSLNRKEEFKLILLSLVEEKLQPFKILLGSK